MDLRSRAALKVKSHENKNIQYILSGISWIYLPDWIIRVLILNRRLSSPAIVLLFINP